LKFENAFVLFMIYLSKYIINKMNKLLFAIDEKNISKIFYHNTLKLGIKSCLDTIDRKIISNKIININPTKSINDLFSKKYWDIKIFEKENSPTIVNTIGNKQFFQQRVGG